MPEITYGELFAYLGRLGFAETLRTELDKVLEHKAQGIVLVFSPAESDDSVCGADLLSVETRLQHHGILVGPIQAAIRAARVK